jgi:hypothetical protein
MVVNQPMTLLADIETDTTQPKGFRNLPRLPVDDMVEGTLMLTPALLHWQATNRAKTHYPIKEYARPEGGTL